MTMSIYGHIGFIPASDPVLKLPQEFEFVDEIAVSLPQLVAGRKFRSVADELVVQDYQKLKGPVLDRAMMLYSYFASAYVWGAKDEKESKRIPEGIAVPLVQLAKKLDRPPILSYDSYCLNNWQRKAKRGMVEVNNLKLVQKFVECYDEDWFILIHVDIERKGADALRAISELRTHAFVASCPTYWLRAMKMMLKSLKAMNKVFARMPERCNPEVYFDIVRPYIYSFNDVVYEGCFDDRPQSYRGETGAQSSLIPAIQLALGIRHKQSMLTKHLDDMRQYMPLRHRQYLSLLEAAIPPYDKSFKPDPVKYDIRSNMLKLDNKDVNTVYNQCIEQLWEFRDQHFTYAVDYIHKKVTNPTGTGGTPYMKWLQELRDETKGFMI
jgi:indoleamine 2,3-dioxygenase